MTILIFGDIVGRIGREAVAKALPDLRKTYTPDLIIANIENLAHGAGITVKTLTELSELGIDVFTGGNHLWDKPAYQEIFSDPTWTTRIARPLNESRTVPGHGSITFERCGRSITLMNIMGQVFFKQAYTSPFEALNKALTDVPESHIILVDMHAEATSEKAVMGRWLDGRVSAIWGTHTHVPSADERILPKGTAFATDVGPSMAHNESIGICYEQALSIFKDGVKTPLTPPDAGPSEVNALVLTFEDGNRFPTNIKRWRRIFPNI